MPIFFAARKVFITFLANFSWGCLRSPFLSLGSKCIFCTPTSLEASAIRASAISY